MKNPAFNLFIMAITAAFGAVAFSPLAKAQSQATPPEATIELAAPEPSIEIFAAYQPVSQIDVVYDDISAFMNSFSVIDKSRVKLSYDTIRRGGTNALLKNLLYLRDIEVTQMSRPDQLAYWLNLRNLLVVFAVAADGASELVQERGTFAAPGELWTHKRIHVEGVHLSIDDIERNIILAHWDDPNILYGLYQGIEGGPSLYKPGFRGESVNDILPKLGRRYINAKKTITVKGGQANVPAIYAWYGDIFFAGDEAKVLKHVRRLSRVRLLSKLEKVDSVKISEISYRIDTTGTVRKSRKPRSVPTQPRGTGARPAGRPRSGS